MPLTSAFVPPVADHSAASAPNESRPGRAESRRRSSSGRSASAIVGGRLSPSPSTICSAGFSMWRKPASTAPRAATKSPNGKTAKRNLNAISALRPRTSSSWTLSMRRRRNPIWACGRALSGCGRGVGSSRSVASSPGSSPAGVGTERAVIGGGLHPIGDGHVRRAASGLARASHERRARRCATEPSRDAAGSAGPREDLEAP
jgi:hypothetical protein